MKPGERPTDLRTVENVEPAFTNQIDAERKQFWSDAATDFDRRIGEIELSVSRSVWSLPVLVALGFATLALAVAIFLLYKLIKRQLV